MKNALIIFRNGTLIKKIDNKLLPYSLENLEFYPGVFQNLSKIAREKDFDIFVIIEKTKNSDGDFNENNFDSVQQKLIQAFKNEGVEFVRFFIFSQKENNDSDFQQLETQLLKLFLKGNYSPDNSFIIGNNDYHRKIAESIACKALILNEVTCNDLPYSVNSWSEIYSIFSSQLRKAAISRKTSETDIEIFLNLDGNGKHDISTGLGFFNHLLEQIAKHGNVDLSVSAKGDLIVDEHHTIEDVAIALGEAFIKALGSKKGIERYGFVVPMDDCIAQVALDFGGRPFLQWETVFLREKIGDLPTEMFEHFFNSFCISAKCNLNIKAEGTNEHHKIEAIFKAFARAVKMAVNITNNFSIPSTKGLL
ncbi:MAG: imidazoleglycerol-phosphate dehydratase HisB [Bacteroidales bacterium]|nr:imidazoleglycerol-phosphate dehydratase HisB [Bacteroidales bacterium]